MGDLLSRSEAVSKGSSVEKTLSELIENAHLTIEDMQGVTNCMFEAYKKSLQDKGVFESRIKRDPNILSAIYERDQEIKRLQSENARMKKETHDLQMRLSEMASERLQKDNPLVEDLSDALRHSALKDRWERLFASGEYWNTFSQLRADYKDDKKIADILYYIVKVAYETAVDTVDILSSVTREAAKVSLCQTQLDRGNAGNFNSIQRILSTELLKKCIRIEDLPYSTFSKHYFEQLISLQETALSHATTLLDVFSVAVLKSKDLRPFMEQIMKKKISEDVHLEQYSDKITPLAVQVIDLFYSMRALPIPLVVDFDDVIGKPLNPSLYQVEDKNQEAAKEAAVKIVFRPPLLRCANGALLLKGEVALDVSEGKVESAKDKRQDDSSPDTEVGGNEKIMGKEQNGNSDGSAVDSNQHVSDKKAGGSSCGNGAGSAHDITDKNQDGSGDQDVKEKKPGRSSDGSGIEDNQDARKKNQDGNNCGDGVGSSQDGSSNEEITSGCLQTQNGDQGVSQVSARGKQGVKEQTPEKGYNISSTAFPNGPSSTANGKPTPMELDEETSNAPKDTSNNTGAILALTAMDEDENELIEEEYYEFFTNGQCMRCDK